MLKRTSVILLFVLVFGAFAAAGTNENSFENFTQNQKIEGFSVVNLYDGPTGKAVGVRLVSDRYGFVVDLFYVQSVPQAFFWAKALHTDDRGEAHTCEHLLLGKGIRGRMARAIEDMSLGTSSALTSQFNTVYGFSTIAGEDAFYKIFEAKLQAFVNPDFTDEEIRREVCHIGVTSDPRTGKLSLDEKGTVYTEMVSSFEQPNRTWYKMMQELIYGEDHPASNIGGGTPASIRTMVPQDLWNFHKANYHLGNMGAIIAIPDNISLHPFLKELSAIFARCQTNPETITRIGISNYELPPAKPIAPAGTIKIVDCPGNGKQDPANITYVWPADLEFDPNEGTLLDLFLATFTGDAPSNLYNMFINSSTRVINIGGAGISGSAGNDLGHPIAIYFGGVGNAHVSETMIDSVRSLIVSEIKRVAEFPDGSDSLVAFNKRAQGQLAQMRRGLENLLNTPPRFGARALYVNSWFNQLEALEKVSGFRKSMVDKAQCDFAENLLNTKENFWKKYIDRWHLLTVKPYGIGGRPNEAVLQKEKDDKAARIADYIETFKARYGVSDDQLAIARYKDEFDKNTAALAKLSEKAPIPSFTNNPPLTLDDQLHYETITLPSNIPMVASTFDNMTCGNVGLALRMDVVPESLLVYVPLIPDILTNIGVIRDGKPIPYEEMSELLRKEILGLNAYYDIGYQRQRVELMLYGSGGNLDELKRAIDWMQTCLYSPYLTKENIPRILDILDQDVISLHSVMKGVEETWVNGPAGTYMYQTNPLIMSVGSFLTQSHHLQRLRWLLTDPGNQSEKTELIAILDSLAAQGKGRDRQQLNDLLTALQSGTDSTSALARQIKAASPVTGKTIGTVLSDLSLSLGDIPDASLASDWDYLLRETKADLLVDPSVPLARIDDLLKLIRRTDNARAFMVSSTADRDAVMDRIVALTGKLDSQTKSVRRQYSHNEHILDRLREREPGAAHPYLVGLVNTNTRNGVIIASAPLTDSYDTTTSSILNQLPARVLGGNGAHGLFMKTWGAGLAYSNGASFDDRTGRIRYYAERCPDITETDKFVASQVKTTPTGPELLDYATAQMFGTSRAGLTYQARAQAMAADLTDGFTPDIVKRYRLKVMAVRKQKDLFDQIKPRMESTFGKVLLGLGTGRKDVPGGLYFIIGPDAQFQALENYAKTVGDPQPVYRLYPRDFWLTMP